MPVLPFRSTPLLALFAALSFTASPLAAQEEQATEVIDFSQMDEAELIQALRAGQDRWLKEACTYGVPLFQRFAELRSDRAPISQRPIERSLLMSKIFCAVDEERYEEGLALTDDFRELEPEEPLTDLTLVFINHLEDPDAALRFLSALEGNALRSLNKDSFWLTYRMLRDAGEMRSYEQLALGWFDAAQIGFIDGELHSDLAMAALRASAREGRGELADQLISYVTEPGDYLDMLTDRAYEPFWPQLEARAGANLENISAEYVTITRRRLTNAPRDRDRFEDAVRALFAHGEFAEAVALADTWRERAERGLKLEEGDAWAIGLQARAHDALGEPDQADEVYDQVLEIDPEENSWVVSMVINRAARLVRLGRWDEALPALEHARTVPGSAYAEMVVARNLACTLRALGRNEEAEAELAFLRENQSTSVGLAALGLMCFDEREEAAQVLIRGLQSSATRRSALRLLTREVSDPEYRNSVLPQLHDLREEFPELAEAFDANARDLPEAFTPRSALLRAKLDLPEWE